MDEIKIKLIPKSKMSDIYPVLKQCDMSIDEETLKERFFEMQKMDYRCIGVYYSGKLIGISGLWFLNKYYVGKHVEPDNVYILPEYRGSGLGHRLMQWIEDYARKEGCQAVELNCYMVNEKGREFWEKEGYLPLGIHYQKIL